MWQNVTVKEIEAEWTDEYFNLMLQHLKERLDYDAAVLTYEQEKAKAEREAAQDRDTTTGRTKNSRTFTRRLRGAEIFLDSDTGFSGATPYPNRKVSGET